MKNRPSTLSLSFASRIGEATILFLVCLMIQWSASAAFVVQRVPSSPLRQSQFPSRPLLQLNLLLDPSAVAAATTSFSTMVVAEGEQTWRQYVSLVVIGGVLIDIVLGSPVANTLLKPMRGDSDADDNEDAEGNPKRKNTVDRSKERIDSESVAKAAIDRAQNALELRRFLDERKTDWDRMEDMKRKLDAEMQDLDADLQQREESLAKRRQGDTSSK